MTGYQSKKAAASAKTIDQVNWADHEPDGRRAEQELIVGTKTWFEDGKVVTQYLTAKEVYKEPAQWDTPSEAFNAWWDGEYDDSTNPFTKDTFGYWAFAGWQAALAQPAQEPVGEVKPVIVSPPNADADEMNKQHGDAYGVDWKYPDAAQPAQEPVAFYNPQHGGFYWAKPTTISAPQAVDIVPLALYTTPPQRTWVDLTDDEEIADYLGDEYHTMTESDLRFFRLGVAAAKEKNNG